MRLLTISLLCASNLALASSQIVDSRLNSDSNISTITSSASGKGAYASANLGTAVAYATIGSVHEIRANSLSWGGAVGYNTSKKFALEGGVLGVSLKVRNDSSADSNMTQSFYGYAPYATTKFIVPVSSKFSIDFKLGLIYLDSRLTNVGKDATSNRSIVLPFTGVGVSYAVTPHVEINVHYQGLVYVIVGAGQMGVGVTYHFD